MTKNLLFLAILMVIHQLQLNQMLRLNYTTIKLIRISMDFITINIELIIMLTIRIKNFLIAKETIRIKIIAKKRIFIIKRSDNLRRQKLLNPTRWSTKTTIKKKKIILRIKTFRIATFSPALHNRRYLFRSRISNPKILMQPHQLLMKLVKKANCQFHMRRNSKKKMNLIIIINAM